MSAIKRILNDWNDIQEMYLNGIHAKMDHENIMQWNVSIKDPREGYDGSYMFHVQFSGKFNL